MVGAFSMPRRLKFHVPVPRLGSTCRRACCAGGVAAAVGRGVGAGAALRGGAASARAAGGGPAGAAGCLPARRLHEGPWKELPAGFGKADTVSRQFRRWAEAGLWEVLLHSVVQQGREPGLRGLAYFVCRAFRRAHRILGLCGLRLARALGMDSALRAPRDWLPDPDLSEHYHERFLLPGAEAMARRPWAVALAVIRVWQGMLTRVKGRARIARWMAPA
jgi:transposase